ncbi:hypothetical protein [Massilia sp. 9096]|uniref:hypothetical protein n=1 Tax=Massilia sp. 9096 TaxID=1500894 RepID=UPI000AB53F00|nr:hypothetical protein [Massilia sp. 9096]
MNVRLASAQLATQFHRPLRFGRLWRGHELALRAFQVVLILFLAVFGARLIAHGIALASQAIARLIS